MAVTRREALVTAAVGGLVAAGVAHADEKTPVRSGVEPLTDAERQRLEEGGGVVTKTFIAALRERLSDKEAAKLREFIDPRYLKEHGLQEGAFPIQRVVTGDIYSNHLSADPTTALVVAGTEGGVKECFLFRLTVHEKNVYIAPLRAPDKKSKSFSPWILRVKV
jgi:hypothetical protein